MKKIDDRECNTTKESVLRVSLINSKMFYLMKKLKGIK